MSDVGVVKKMRYRRIDSEAHCCVCTSFFQKKDFCRTGTGLTPPPRKMTKRPQVRQS